MPDKPLTLFKQRYLDAAEVFDAWRVVPRLVLFGYCWWVAHVTDKTLNWYMTLPPADRTLEASGLAGAIITAITGMSVWVYKVYSDTGRDWTSVRSSSTTLVSTATTQ